MKDGLERVLTYLPHMSAYQMFLFLFCYYGYMGVATAVAGNIFYQYRISVSLKQNRSHDSLLNPLFRAAHFKFNVKKPQQSVQILRAVSLTMQHNLSWSTHWPLPTLAIHVVFTTSQLKMMSAT